MKKSRFKKGFAGLMATLMCAMSVPATTAFAADQQDKGKTSDGYDYEMWNQYGQGQVSFNPGTNGSFTCSWSNIENFLGRTGRKLTDKKPYSTYGTITVDYDVDYKPDGNSYMCIYGWTEDPTVEYYIVQAWGTWRPPGQQGGGLGTFSSDGSTYNIYKSTRVNQPSIHGTETFDQYWSVNTTNPAKAYSSTHLTGTITVSDHFKKWEGAGLKMGTLWEVSLNIEGYQSNGSAKVNKNKLTMNASTNPNQTTNPSTTPSTPATPTVQPNSDGSYWKSDFESGAGDWVARGTGTSIATDSSNHVGGSKGLAVTGRGDTWHGAEISLDSGAFVGGNEYSFSVAAMQNSGSSETLKMTLQYSLGGEDKYDEVASVKAASGEWVKLENTSFKIPSGATNLVLYVEAPDGTSDFYIDDAMAAKSGTKSSINLSNASSSTPATNPNPNPNTNTNNNTNTNTNTNNSASTNFNTSDPGLKDYFSSYFKIGTSVSPNELGSGASFLKKNYNSITPENELKPDAIIDQQASMQRGNNVNTQVNLSRAANTLKFCEENGISLRGHTFVWYSQTPDWFFKENFSDNGNWVSKQVMDQRLESFIKNTFEAIAKQYPKLDLYSYDVCNELFKNDGGGMRPSRAQDGQQGSRWVQIYGDDSFVLNAFKYARKYAPANCKLYLNDYNEYIGAKTTDIYNMALKVKAEGNIDGIGMQSHLATNYPDKNTYSAALDKFLSTGLDVQITELDITCSDFQSQASLYKDIFTLAMDASEKTGKVPALTIWGTQDPVSWRSSQNPLLFSSGYKPKPAYDAVIGLVPPEKIGKTSNSSVVQTPTSAPNNNTNTNTNTNTNPSVSADADFGDVTLDGSVGLSDALAILQYVANAQKFPLSEKAINNGDVYNRGDGITAADALSIQKYDAKVITKLPESWSANATANTNTNNNSSSNTNNNSSSNTNNNNSSASTNTGSVKAISSSFESGKDGWASRGDVTVESDSDNYYSGSKSLKISNRGDAWQGLGYELGSDFKAGGTYSFSAAVLQGSGSAETMKMSLQYENGTGETQYDQIATASVADKTWTKLENTEYTIPDNATDLLLYIETDTSLTDIYVDDVFAGDKGTASKVTTGGGKVNITAASTPSVTPSTGNTSIDPSKPMIAISFDDGASPQTGTRIIDALDKSGFHATFFYVGDWIKDSAGENEVKYAYSKGMEIANHTTSHPHLPQLGSSQIRSEFDNTHAKLKRIIGAEPSKLMRLPYLESNGTVESTLNDVALISCQFDTQDWNGHSKDQIVNDIKGWVTSGQGNGAIVLCHETYASTASAMEEVLPWIKSQGWQVVTISEMAAAKGKTLSGGTVYKRV
ncbi:MAG: endo-1,4-beta-xylanase [Ruminococcus sp.]|nr:endo-1,4-beta-xylanase [Ruminococcus sp.]